MSLCRCIGMSAMSLCRCIRVKMVYPMACGITATVPGIISDVLLSLFFSASFFLSLFHDQVELKSEIS